MDVFCVFEGGGAKGVAHVGFLKSIDKHDGYTAHGYAGTSAGAILAALAAAGWKGDELFSEGDAGTTSAAFEVLSKHCNREIGSLADLLEPDDWKVLRRCKELINRANVEESGDTASDVGQVVASFLNRYLWCVGFVVILTSLSLLLPGTIWLLGLLILLFLLLPGLLAAVALKYFSSRFSGIASMDVPREMLETLLRHKIPEASGPEITFRDIKNYTGNSLKVVAADLENGNLKLFGTESTLDVSVARAVTASAAIPILFKPVDIAGRQYCDGGIVSNLPAWTFDSERISNEDCLTITCEVSPPKDLLVSRPRLRGLRLFARVGITTLFGGSDLNTRGMLRHLPLSAWHSIKMLDFEKSKEQIELIKASEEQADIKMDLERLHRTGIEGLHKKLTESLAEKGIHECSLRVAYARYVNLVDAPPAAYHLWNCLGFEGFPDRSITLPAKGSLIGDCLDEMKARWFDLEDPVTKERYFNVGNGVLADRLPKDRAWVAIVPIQEQKTHGRVSAAVCIDCDVKIDSGDITILPKFSDLVAKFA